MDAFELPDGTIAETTKDVDKYLKYAKICLASDYSKEFLKNARYLREKAEKADRFNDFVLNYKRKIWNE